MTCPSESDGTQSRTAPAEVATPQVAVSGHGQVGKVTVIGAVHGSVHVETGSAHRHEVLRTSGRPDVVRRRSVLRMLGAGLGLGLSDEAAEKATAVRGRTEQLLALGTPALGVLDDWEQAVHGYALRYATAPPLAYLNELLPDILDLQDLVESLRLPDAQRRALRALGRLSSMVAVVADDLGRARESRRWMQTARRLAVASGDRELLAWTFARAGFIALHYAGSASEAARLAEAAVAHAPRRSPVAATMGHTVASRALAVRADRDGAIRALGTAEESQTAAPAHGPLGLFDWTVQQAALSRGITLTTLGRTGPALAAQHEALTLFDASEWLDPALVRLNQAALLVRHADLDEGCRTATAVLQEVPAEHRSPLLASWADEVVRSIPGHLTARPEARDLAEARRLFARSEGDV